jgi:NAD(P)-dependent dehydrogenase (short-subunit alcohol dehydrogenase family)
MFLEIAITGAASGMGFATAQLLAKRGAYLSLADLNETALSAASESLAGGTNRHLSMPVDVRSSASVDEWIDKTVQRFGRLDGAVNMAGVLGPSSPITDITNDQMDFVLSVNLNGVFNCLRAQLGVMESGSIVRSPSSRR